MSDRQLLEGFEDYTQDNWDGEGARAIPAEIIDVARSILNVTTNQLTFPRADIAPGFNGSIGMVWEDSEFYTYLTIRDSKNAKLYIRNPILNEDRWITTASSGDLVKAVIELLSGLKPNNLPFTETKNQEVSTATLNIDLNAVRGNYPDFEIPTPSFPPEFISVHFIKTGTDS